MKKLIALVLALALVLASCAVAFADDPTNGSITITNVETGKKYDLYKLFDATVSSATDTNGNYLTAYTTTKDVTNDTYFNTYFTKDANGYVTKKAALTETVLKSAEFKTWAKTFAGSTPTATHTAVTSDGSEYTFSNLKYGYYFIESWEPDASAQGGFSAASGTILTVDSANPTASVIDKNQTNKSDKKIVEGQNKQIVNEAGINENVSFELTETVKNFQGDEKIFRYQIEDTLDPAFSYNQDSVAVTINGTTTLNAYNADTNKNGYKITFSTNESTHKPSFVMTIPWTNNDAFSGDHLYPNNSTIVITYTAKLDPTKIATNPTDLHVGNAANENTAQLKWFKGSENPTTPNGQLPENKTETFDTSLKIIKHDQAGNVLTGAEFTLTTTNGTTVALVTENTYTEDNVNGTHYKLKNGTYTTEAPNNNATHDSLYDSTEKKYKLVTTYNVEGAGRTNTTISAFVDDNGEVTFTGLGVGTYTISETVVPAGYNKAADITFTLTFDPTTKRFSSNNSAVAMMLDGSNKALNTFETTVVNNKGTELPSTGGIGTTIFYIVGGLLVIGAAVILVARRKAHE